MQDLVNLFYDEEDFAFSLRHEVKENASNFESHLFVDDKEYVKIFEINL